jgi:hypothetical protein
MTEVTANVRPVGRRAVSKVMLAAFALSAVLAPAAEAVPSRVVLHVDDDAAPGGDGSGRAPFDNLPAAVAAARSSSRAAVINVAPGDYVLTEPLLIDTSVDVRGSTVPVERAQDPWPTGEVVPGTQTRIRASSAIGSQPLIQIGRNDGAVLHNVRVRGLVLEGTATGTEMLLTRVQGFSIADNIFRAPALFAFVSVASSGRLAGNHFSGVGTGAIFNGGYPESPSRVIAVENRSVRNTLGGILLNGASIDIPELGDELHAVVRNNDLSDNSAGNQGFGLRLFILRRDPGAPGDTQSAARIDATVQSNRMRGNRIGVMIDAGFPYRQLNGTCDPRVFTGDVDLELAGNEVTSSVTAPALVTFTRNAAALNPSLLPQWQYLHGATFRINDRDGTLQGALIDHPTTDPFTGPCPGDQTHEPLGNALIYNGELLANARNF